MNSVKSIKNENPRKNANIFSVLSWWWTLKLFNKGCKKKIELEDLYEPLNADKSNVLGDRLENKWNAEVLKANNLKYKPSLLKTIFKTFWPEYLALAFLNLILEFALRFGTPLLLSMFLKYFKPEPLITYHTALIYAAAISVSSMIYAVISSRFYFDSVYVGGKIRIAACSLVYRKALRLNGAALGETPSGKVVNLVANDISRFELIPFYLQYLWSGPLSAMFIAFLLYRQAGWTGFIGMIPVLIIIPVQSYTGKLNSKYRLQTALKTDERVRLMKEIISGIQVIKMYAWERPFCVLVKLVRRLELRAVRKNAYIRAMYMAFNLFTPRVALYCTLTAMLLTDENPTAEKIFVFASYFNMLAFTLSGKFVRAIAEIAECMVAVRRLQKFLSLKEFEPKNTTKNVTFDRYSLDDKNEDDKCAVSFDRVKAKWDLDSSENTLDDVSVELDKGKLYVVIGLVGSGKSSLLSTILGELNLIEGEVRVNGEVSYASQEAWIFGGSIRENILFGLEYHRQKYQRVVKACALKQDFKQLPQGDLAAVGERGSSLSGGQKARINLARAIYKRADIYLLDDPLSAVDVHVGKHLFEECIQKYLRSETRILATHQLRFVKAADRILVMEQGRIRQYSDYRDLLEVHPEYTSLINSEDDKKEEIYEDHSGSEIIRRKSSRLSTASRGSGKNGTDEENDLQSLTEIMENTSQQSNKGNMIIKYLATGSGSFLLLTLVPLFLITQFLTSTNDLFVPVILIAEESRSFYQSRGQDNSTANKTRYILDEEYILPREDYVYIYSGIILSLFILVTVRSLTFFTLCARTSKRLHDKAFDSLIRASMRFYDKNPSGRILNRFFKDFGIVDERLPKSISEAAQNFLFMIGSITVTCSVNPRFFIAVLIMGVIFYYIRMVYLKTSIDVRRLEGMTCSPVFTHLNTTLDGLSTIRACQAEKILKREFDSYMDIHTASWFISTGATAAFSFALYMLCFVFISVITFSFLLFKEHFFGGQVGLAITQVMALAAIIQDTTRTECEVLNQLTSFERVLEYTYIEPEPNAEDEDSVTEKKKKKNRTKEIAAMRRASGWPDKGRIEFKDVTLRYSDEDPPVLKGLTLSIRSGEKIGIVGRTGAGKSSLIYAFFRLAKIEGIIEIDGLDTSQISLSNLRRHISIIPQDPVLFSGTLRYNLDPFQEYSDAVLWDVLNKVELKKVVEATGKGLDHRVLDRGSNYSVGQRQMICLARAIMRNNRILVMDEATANVDPQTDAFIQRTVRTQFASCTVLTIAHRLNTIMDSDRVLVMSDGRVEEFDHPHVLLSNETGHFSALVNETDSKMYKQLCDVARISFETKIKRISSS